MHPTITSWGFSWAAEGRSPSEMTEMRWFIVRFEASLAEQGRDLMTATRADCETFLSSYPTPSRRSYAWRSLRSYYRFVSDDLEIPNPAAKIKAPKVPLTDVKTATEDDVRKLLKACSPFRTTPTPGTPRSSACCGYRACAVPS